MINLFDLKDDQCRYQLEDGTYCGCAVKKNYPYCEEHHKICYKPKPKGLPKIGPEIYQEILREREDLEPVPLYILLR